MKQTSIVIASGGTGGHLYPTIAVADEVKRIQPDINVVFVGTKDRIESREVPRAGYDFRGITIEAPKKSLSSLMTFPLQLSTAVYDCYKIFNELRPRVMLGGGAYLSVPVGIGAWMFHTPIALLEINSIAGTANKWLSHVAEKVFVAYPEAKKSFSDRLQPIVTVSGTPVRNDLGKGNFTKEEARSFFNLDPNKPTILVFGGSLGARAINEAMAQSAKELAQRGYNVLWQTGKGNNAEGLAQEFAAYPSVKVQEYIFEMERAYAAADLVVARAGASTLAELSHLGKPAILVPYPFAAANHQEENARAFEQTGAAVVLRDMELKEKLLPLILDLMSNEDRRTSMATNVRRREHENAARAIAEWLVLRATTEERPR